MVNAIGLDFETYCDVNLPKHGSDRYFSSPNFKVLLASVATAGDTECLDFVCQTQALESLENMLDNDCAIVAHNVDFERHCLERLGIDVDPSRFVDSAMIARAAGASSSLESAAPQLLNTDKMAAGQDLIKLFSIPGKYQPEGSMVFDDRIVDDNPMEWALFKSYCNLDAELSRGIWQEWGRVITVEEFAYQELTSKMNQVGWHVDMPLVQEMQKVFNQNTMQQLTTFQAEFDSEEARTFFNPVTDLIEVKEPLNFNSPIQLKKWCADRGVKATSFDESHVIKLLVALGKKLGTLKPGAPMRQGYEAVRQMLLAKQALGGSSLKKLQTIIDLTNSDDILRNQYKHAGAGQTLRTSGQGVQMQNLKRLGSDIRDMSTVFTDPNMWSNEDLANNLRQVFTSRHEQGELIVGDFSSVESRGLAYLAGAEWKLEAFRAGKDMYKVLAEKIFSISYNAITKSQRSTGKVGELSCGYGAGAGAVHSFAQGMGVNMSEQEAGVLVQDWRRTNPEVVALWDTLHNMLLNAVRTGNMQQHELPNDNLTLIIVSTPSPASLQKQVGSDATVRTLHILVKQGSRVVMRRIFHGCYMRGRNIGYFKPTSRKTGDLWANHTTDQKTKQIKFYSVYGGKLAGILTQSFCREIFFRVLKDVAAWVDAHPNMLLVGQFHDEIVLDWWPMEGGISLVDARDVLTMLMSQPGSFKKFPLAAEVHSDYRYIK